MKRLLLPLLAALALPNAVNAFPFGNDVTIENTIGEKILIKGKTISTENLKKNDLINLIEKNIRNKKELKSKRESYGDRRKKDYFKYKDQCDTKGYNSHWCSQSLMNQAKNHWENTLIRVDKIEGQISALENLKSSIIKDVNNPNLIHIISIDFTPVYIDLNNQKKVGAAERIYCLNQALAKEKINYSQTWIDQSSDSDKELFKKGLLLNKVCKKYAKF